MKVFILHKVALLKIIYIKKCGNWNAQNKAYPSNNLISSVKELVNLCVKQMHIDEYIKSITYPCANIYGK